MEWKGNSQYNSHFDTSSRELSLPELAAIVYTASMCAAVLPISLTLSLH